MMLDLAKEFGFKHRPRSTMRVEAYKIADLLAAEGGICGFNVGRLVGLQDGSARWHPAKTLPWSIARKTAARSCIRIPAEGIQRLNQEAAKVIARSGNRSGHAMARPENAMRWLSHQCRPKPWVSRASYRLAWKPGKMADVVVWNGMPFSVYAKAEKVYRRWRTDVRYQQYKALQPDIGLSMVGQGVSAMKSSRFCLACLIAGTVPSAQNVLIKNATVHTAGVRGTLKNSDVLVQGGIIRAIGPKLLIRTGRKQSSMRKANRLTPGLFAGLGRYWS